VLLLLPLLPFGRVKFKASHFAKFYAFFAALEIFIKKKRPQLGTRLSTGSPEDLTLPSRRWFAVKSKLCLLWQLNSYDWDRCRMPAIDLETVLALTI